MQKVNTVIQKKLCRLSSFLYHACEEFQTITKQIREKNARMSVRRVALKVKQCEGELDSQLYMLRIKCIVARTDNIKHIKPVNTKNVSDKKIIELCCNSELFFSNAYHSILNEYFPYNI